MCIRDSLPLGAAGGPAVRQHHVRGQAAARYRRGRRHPLDAVLPRPGDDRVPGRARLLRADPGQRGRHVQGGPQPRRYIFARDWSESAERGALDGGGAARVYRLPHLRAPGPQPERAPAADALSAVHSPEPRRAAPLRPGPRAPGAAPRAREIPETVPERVGDGHVWTLTVVADQAEEGQDRRAAPVSYTHLRAHETPEHLVCRLLLEKKK